MSFFDDLFGYFSGLKSVTCPFCLQTNSLRDDQKNCRIDGCGREIPFAYRKEHKNLKPLFIPMIGWTNVGKTMSILSMMLTFDKISHIWEGFVRDYGSQETQDWVRKTVRELEMTGQLPQATPENIQPAYIMLLHSLPRWRYANSVGGRTLVLRDFGGELFRDMMIPKDQVYFLKDAPTIVMMFSLADHEHNQATKDRFVIDELLQSYVTTMQEQQRIDLKNNRRNLVVVLTQADKLSQSNLIPEHLIGYLHSDPIARALETGVRDIWSGERMGQYLEEMNRASDDIAEWLVSRFPSAQMLVSRARKHNMGLKFCITSATGRLLNPDTKALLEPPKPKRILDPLFCALQFEEIP